MSTATFTLSGTCADPTGAGVAGATLAVLVDGQSGPSATSGTDGTWSIGDVAKGSDITVTPSLSGHVFSPENYPQQDVAADNDAIDFTVTAVAFSGTVWVVDSTATAPQDFLTPLPNVAVALTGDVGGVQGVYSAQTDAGGVFSFTGVSVGSSYRIALTAQGYTQALPVPFNGVAQATTPLTLAMYPVDQEGEVGQAVWEYVVGAVGVAALAVSFYQVFLKSLVEGIFTSVAGSLPIQTTATAVAAAIRSLTAQDVMDAADSGIEMQQFGSTPVAELLDNAVDAQAAAEDAATQAANAAAKQFVQYLVEQGADAVATDALAMLNSIQVIGYNALMASLQTVRVSTEYAPELSAAMDAIKSQINSEVEGAISGDGSLSEAGQQALAQLQNFDEFLDFSAQYSSELFQVSADAFVSGATFAVDGAAGLFASLVAMVMDLGLL